MTKLRTASTSKKRESRQQSRQQSRQRSRNRYRRPGTRARLRARLRTNVAIEVVVDRAADVKQGMYPAKGPLYPEKQAQSVEAAAEETAGQPVAAYSRVTIPSSTSVCLPSRTDECWLLYPLVALDRWLIYRYLDACLLRIGLMRGVMTSRAL